MEIEKDKKIVIITSGIFLCLLAVMLFVTLMRRDNMIGSTPHRGSTSELNLGDTCTEWQGSTSYVLNGTIANCNGLPTRANAGATAVEACELEGMMEPTAYACSESDSSEEVCAIIVHYTRTCSADPDPTPTATPTTTPTATPTTSPSQSVQCYKFENNQCSSNKETVSGSSCNAGDGYYATLDGADGCWAQIQCNSDNENTHYRNQAACLSCPENSHVSGFHCSGNQQDCCQCDPFYTDTDERATHISCSPSPTATPTPTPIRNCQSNEYVNISNACATCPNGMVVKSNCTGTQDDCCDDPDNPSNLKCYYTHNECNPTSPPGNACNNSSGYYDERSDCVSNLTCPTGKYKTSSGCSRCENGTQLRSDNCTGTQDTCCEETTSTCSVSNCKTCSSNNNNVCTKCNSNYKLVQGRCVLVTAPCCVDNTTTYTDDATCQAKINSTDPHYIVSLGECSTCSVPNCHTCLSNANNKCGICDNDYILNSEGQCVHIEGECCSPSGTKGETECRTLANSGVNITLGACGISSVSGDQSINITPSTSPVSTTYSAFDTLGGIMYSGLTWTVSGDGVEKNTTYCKNGICTVKFHHQGTNTCGPRTTYATVTASDGNSSKTVNVTVNSYCDWTETQGTYTFSTQQKTRDAMKYTSGCTAYEGETSSNGPYQYTRKYDRCCGCGGGDNPTPTPTPSKQKYCYIKVGNATNNDYCYDYAENCTGYTGPITRSSCGEAEACYLVNGQYKMGKFEGQGYMYVGTTCPKTEQKHCYVKYGNGTDNTYCYNTPSICTGYDDVIYGKDGTNCGENNACYRVDSDGSYVIGMFNNQPGYTYYGVTCPNPDEACYKKPNGEYYWTNKPSDDDIEITSITDEDKCQTPTDDEKCYKNTSDNTYHWSKISEADPGWIEQTGISKPEDCNDEDPACYKKTSTGEYDWGKYKNVIGWQPVTGVNSETECKRPNPACYVDPKGKYVWGNYEDDIQYTKVNGISSYDECMKSSPVIPVPKTALDRLKIIYVTVCIFALAGAGLIVYSKNKKETLIKKD